MNLHNLYIHNIDFHYHAGQERQQGTTLRDYIEHAELTGRIVLGVTDHLERYIGQPPSAPMNVQLYEQSVQGLLDYRGDVDALRGSYPSLHIAFGPEIHAGPRIDLSSLPGEVAQASDYFLVGLPAVEESPQADTEAKLAQLAAMARMRERVGKPLFVVHPFRSSVNRRLVKGNVEPWVTNMPPRPALDFAHEELDRFFGFDVLALARACAELKIPIEINGGTDGRIRSLNLPAPLQMLWAAYRIFADLGVGLVPGSDQHAFYRPPDRRDGGRYIPFDAFDALGIKASDISFVSEVMGGKVICYS